MTHPQRLGKYEITEVLGEGAMGVVYKGFDPDIRRAVAIKTIRHQLSDGTDFSASISARFRNEAQAAGRLTHPGIVAVYDYGEDQNVAFIAMEFVEGQSLAHCVAHQLRFTDADIPGVMSQLLDALDHAHQQGVWHRDVKPANVIMSRNGRLKVADFGIARIDSGGLTQANTMIGTPSYMAPEQFMGLAIDHRVDIYSAGVLLYVLLTGHTPYSGAPEALMYQAVHGEVRPPSKVEGVSRPRFYDALVAQALAKQPEHRFASAKAFKEALLAGVGEPIDDTAWEKTLVHLPARPRRAAHPLSPGEGAVGAQAHTDAAHWPRETLALAESSLAKYVGPLASVLVRRAARDCADLPALYVRLAEQIDSPAARNAFLSHATASGAFTRPGGACGASARGNSSSVHAHSAQRSEAGSTGEPVSREMAEQAARLLAQAIGPIAQVVVRKALAKAPRREAFVAALAQAVDDPTKRDQLVAALIRLH